MNYKKALLGTLGGAIVAGGMGGKIGLEKGLSLGIKLGFLAGTAATLVASQAYKMGKAKAKEKMHLA